MNKDGIILICAGVIALALWIGCIIGFIKQMKEIKKKKIKEKKTMENKKNTVTNEMIDDLFRNSKTRVETVDGKCTIVTVTLENGFMLTESAACVDKENYSEEIGREICLGKIRDKLWELEGYKLQCELYQKGMHPHCNREETAKERVEQEYEDLYKKRLRLDDFFKSEKFKTMTVKERILLRAQYEIMYQYALILKDRLRLWREF